MLKPVCPKDLSKFKSHRVGKGTFGAKTIELQRFKQILEDRNFVVPPMVSFPIEFFTPLLIKLGFCNQHGEFVEHPERVELPESFKGVFEDSEKRLILQAIKQFSGYPIALRSDELSAKGIGAFSTIFTDLDKEALLGNLVYILVKQFAPTPTAFKQRVGMPHGIGIMIMPLVGDQIDFYGQRIIFPKVSVSGFTSKDQSKFFIHYGYGVGGGVKPNSGLIIQEDSGKTIRQVNCHQDLVRGFALDGISLSTVGETASTLQLTETIPYLFELEEASVKLGKKMIEIAKQLGIDLYWEAQSIDFESEQWAITQISEHVWPEVKKPEGREMLFIGEDDSETVVGSGIVECTGLTRGAVLPLDWDQNLLGCVSCVPESSLVVAPITTSNTEGTVKSVVPLNVANFPVYLNSGAIIYTDGMHSRPVIGHISGIFREAGIPILCSGRLKGFSNAFYLDEISEYLESRSLPFSFDNEAIAKREILKAKRFVVWADELNQMGGVIVP